MGLSLSTKEELEVEQKRNLSKFEDLFDETIRSLSESEVKVTTELTHHIENLFLEHKLTLKFGLLKGVMTRCFTPFCW